MRAKSMGRSVPDFNPEPKMMHTTQNNRSRNGTMLYITLVIVFLVLAIAAISGFKDDSLLLEQRQYCRMVHDWKQSGGEVGWPDYEHAYDVSCNADGSVKAEDKL